MRRGDAALCILTEVLILTETKRMGHFPCLPRPWWCCSWPLPGWSQVCKTDMQNCQKENGWLLLLHTSKMLPPEKTGDIFALILVLFLVRLCCDRQNTVVCMQITAAAGSLWTAPGQGFPLRKKKGSPLFLTLFILSYLAISATLGCIQRSWTPGQRKSDHPLPPPTPEWLFIKVRYSFTFTGRSFCSLSAQLNTEQVTYGLCQLLCKSFVPFNENIANVFLLSLLEPSRILVINGGYWWRNASARPTTLQGHCADPKLQPGVVSTSPGVSAPPCRWANKNLCHFFFHQASWRLNFCIKSHCCHSY